MNHFVEVYLKKINLSSLSLFALKSCWLRKRYKIMKSDSWWLEEPGFNLPFPFLLICLGLPTKFGVLSVNFLRLSRGSKALSRTLKHIRNSSLISTTLLILMLKGGLANGLKRQGSIDWLLSGSWDLTNSLNLCKNWSVMKSERNTLNLHHSTLNKLIKILTVKHLWSLFWVLVLILVLKSPA